MHSFNAILLMKNEIFVLTVCNLFKVYGAQIKNFTIRQKKKNSLEIIKNNVVKKIILGVDTIIQLHHRTTNEE